MQHLQIHVACAETCGMAEVAHAACPQQCCVSPKRQLRHWAQTLSAALLVRTLSLVPCCQHGLSKRAAVEYYGRALQAGQLYNTDDGRKALRDIFALNLFENVQVFTRSVSCPTVC